MTAQTQTEAIALFGSAARGDNDAFSDSDLLIVSDDRTVLKELKAKHDMQGWSSTAYSWKRLQRAADRGSLFVQHLKQESKTIRDPTDRLGHLFAEYEPKPTYARELDSAFSLVGELMQTLPLCRSGPMWALDILSVGFRSMAVAKLADHGIYAFANEELTGGLTRIGTLSKGEGRQLNQLRRFKSMYRRGTIDESVTWTSTFEWIRLIDRALGIGLNPRCTKPIDVVELALLKCSAEDADANWYARCRRVEAALWVLKPHSESDMQEYQRLRQRLFRLIRSPSDYTWQFRGGYDSIQRTLRALAMMSAL